MLLFALTVFSAILSFENKRYLYFILIDRQLDDDQKYEVKFNTLTKDYIPIYRLAVAIKENHRMKNIIDGLDVNAQKVVVDSCSFLSPHIILIIGESYNKHHSSLYGYEKKTTPFQVKRKESKELIVFSDVISTYNLTNKSFQNMLSLYEYGYSKNWYDYPLFTVLFRKAGYEVCFFSNQFVMDTSSSFSDFVEDIFLNNPHLSDRQFTYRNTKLHDYDIKLLGDYHKIAGKRNYPRLTIFHFIGLHADFKERYPPSFGYFSNKQYNRRELSVSERQTIAEYDNAIRYNDYVIDSILKEFEEDDAIAVFLSDHGEMVYDGCHEFGRSLITDSVRVRAHYNIPFWIWSSDKYREQHLEVWNQIVNASNRPFMTDQLPHLLLYLGGISCKDYQADHNLIHHSYNSLRRRMIKGEVSYDDIVKH
jgi:heptose-I-phosphate ethanolaminephosphotransferase